MKSVAFGSALLLTVLACPTIGQTAGANPINPTFVGKTDEQLQAELSALKAELKRRAAAPKRSPVKPLGVPASTTAHAEFTPADLAKKHADLLQRWYVRSDPIDAFYYLYPAAPLDGKGASFSYTEDIENKARAVSVQSFTSYVLARQFFGGSGVEASQGLPELSAAAYAPYLLLNGSLTEPRKASERSALQLGVDSQYEFWGGGGPFSIQNVGFRPYFQSDFRGIGRMEGAQFLWEPYQETVNLGARYDVRQPKLIGFLWRVIGEADVLHVDRAGLSDYITGKTYSWLGGTLQTRMVLFENYNLVPDYICGRIYAAGSYQYFWDAISRISVSDLQAELGYNISNKSTPSTVGCRETAPLPSESLGKTSVSIVYNKGTDRDTLERREKYKLQLNYQY
ncbi:hypothetical protein [Bradyrhizobium sp. SZCCHNS1054]|uniref:hypothetical protein n=1 Tax=Bradyrhizobium sp. SZCCHNS1054 TaxID=3057301 RepID=UPI0029163909|nr:hypothetical protein [Bradyrhizobium sp. SZCCHNS1054]